MTKRLCWKGYASILRYVQIAPRAYTDIAAEMDCWIHGIRNIVNRMHDLKLVHIAGWEKRNPRGAPMALWAFGAGSDAQYPDQHGRGGIARRPNARYLHRPELVAFAQMVRALAEPVTRAELVDLAGSTSANVSRLMQHCKAIGLVRIAAWDSDRPGKPAECLQLGSGRAASRPKPMPREEVQRRCRQARAAKARAQEITAALRAGATPFHVSVALEPAELEAA